MPIHILAIDDDTAMTDLLTMLLRSHGFEITTTNSGEEGVQLVKEETPDIIILDLMMPGVDGWETCKAIRAFSNAPVIVLSALNNPRMVASALDAGADDYLVKPVPSSILVAHINNLARRATNQLKPNGVLIKNPTTLAS